ncbi:MAG: DUF4920 domain-containing protein [Chlorobi bacterium]|nr:DUF4920 domain-containing protein [Chlorobiota bacterium]
MKLVAKLVVLFFAIAMSINAQNAYRGDTITPEGAVTVSQAIEKLEKEGKVANIKVKGKVSAVCQKKGCWMIITDGNKEIKVVFKDYSFFVPKDIDGYEVIVEGPLFYEIISVEQRKHYAQDAGASQEEIDKITEPLKIPMIEARGVIIIGYGKN